jgi:hypothetical protein
MTPPARLRARAASHAFRAPRTLNPCKGEDHRVTCELITDALTPWIEALEVAREALGQIAWDDDYSDRGHCGACLSPVEICERREFRRFRTCEGRIARAALARIAALTPLETPPTVYGGASVPGKTKASPPAHTLASTAPPTPKPPYCDDDWIPTGDRGIPYSGPPVTPANHCGKHSTPHPLCVFCTPETT